MKTESVRKNLTKYQEGVLLSIRLLELGAASDMNKPRILVPSTAFELIMGSTTGQWQRDRLHELASLGWIDEEQLNGRWFYRLTDAGRVCIDDRMRQAIKHCHISFTARF